MNNLEAYDLLKSHKDSVNEATNNFLELFQVAQSEFEHFRYRFRGLISERKVARKRGELEDWNSQMFFHHQEFVDDVEEVISTESLSHNSAINSTSEKEVFIEEKILPSRKHILDITTESLMKRLSILIDHIHFIAKRESVDEKKIATLSLEILAKREYDRKTTKVCKAIISTGTFAPSNCILPFDKAAALFDILEIGKRKYTQLRLICKPEGFIFPTYRKVSLYRHQLALSNDIEIVKNISNYPIGVAMNYTRILSFTTERLIEVIGPIEETHFPLNIEIADGLDGSGSHKVYNQVNSHIGFSTKSFILFAFKMLTIKNNKNKILWSNDTPNSPFVTRPIALISLKENHENVDFIMKTLINHETSKIEHFGFATIGGHVNVKIFRSLFDSKMAATLSGAGGASCQLCTANHNQLKDTTLISDGFPINRHIHDAIEIFNDVNVEDFLKMDSNSRFGLTHPPISGKDILAISPLHSYLCVFRWLMLLIYHLDAGVKKWSPTSPRVKNAMNRIRSLLLQETSYYIDMPSCDGGTSSTGNVARDCFNNKRDFLKWVTSTIGPEDTEKIQTIHTNLGAILRVYNSSHKLDVCKLDSICKDTYMYIVNNFPWVSITPSLHKLLAHSTELITSFNHGYGLKLYSEECVEALNKYVRSFRDKLARKTSFEDNVRDIFVRLITQSDPVLLVIRRNSFRKFEAKQSKDSSQELSQQDIIIQSIIICELDIFCEDCKL